MPSNHLFMHLVQDFSEKPPFRPEPRTPVSGQIAGEITKPLTGVRGSGPSNCRYSILDVVPCQSFCMFFLSRFFAGVQLRVRAIPFPTRGTSACESPCQFNPGLASRRRVQFPKRVTPRHSIPAAARGPGTAPIRGTHNILPGHPTDRIKFQPCAHCPGP